MAIDPLDKKKKPTAQEVNDFHDNDDVDGSPQSHHHSLGPNKGQASPGNHTHDGGSSQEIFPLSGITLTGAKGGNTALASVITALVKLGATDATGP